MNNAAILSTLSRTARPMPTAERVRELLSYDPDTGVFTRRVSACSNAREGDVAGCIKDRGYRAITIDGRKCLAHRLAWLYVYGVWPAAHIDHRNGIRDDNRIANLREATNAENMQNLQRATAGNETTGELGVTWHKPKGKYMAHITIGGNTKFLGYFSAIKAAVAARKDAESALFPFSTRCSREKTYER